jgi:hypothetical protein
MIIYIEHIQINYEQNDKIIKRMVNKFSYIRCINDYFLLFIKYNVY